MEHGEVDTAIVAFQDVLDGGEGVEGLEAGGSHSARALVLRAAVGRLAQTGDVPNSNRLVHRRGDDQVLLGVELGGHNVVRVAGEDGDALPRGTVPDANGLVVRAGDLCWASMRSLRAGGDETHNPWHLVMELNRPDIIQVTMQREQASAILRADI